MPMYGTMLFSHIIPVLLGFSGFFLIITGIMNDKKELLIFGILLFIAACISPFVVLRTLL